MANLKKLVYIFIPIFAILLMSHNTFAVNTMDPYTCWALAGGTIPCQNSPIFTGDEINVISVTRANNNWTTGQVSYGFIWALRFHTSSQYPININLSNGYPTQATISDIQQDCQDTANGTVCNVIVTGLLLQSDYNIQLAGRVSANGAQFDAWSVYFATQYNNGTFEREIYNQLNTIRNYLQTHPEASAQDIADAIENKAEQNTQNAANDSQTAGSSSSQDAAAATSSLISTIGGFVTAVTSASPTNCVINGNMGHLNMGNLDLCANPVPSYIQIIGSIILICAVIPLAIILFNRFIGLFRSFQG